MSYLDTIRNLEMDGIKVGMGKDFSTFYFYIDAKDGTEIRLFVENEEDQLRDEFYNGDPLDRMESIIKYAKKPMFLPIEDLKDVSIGDEEEMPPINGMQCQAASYL